MDARFKGKVVLVTGAASGIGRAAALAFAREEAKVIVSDLVTEGGQETVHLIKEAGGEASFIQADISRAGDVQALIQKIVDIYGRLDCAFNNAGIESPLGPLIECSEEAFDLNMSVNLKGTWLCLKHEIPQMIKQGGGVIVNAASTAGLVGAPGLGVYGASKGGIIQLTRTAAMEYAKQSIRVNVVCPGAITTPMLQRLIDYFIASGANAGAAIGETPIGKPEDIAEAALWLCSDAACFVNGDVMAVDGGYTAG